GVFAPIGQGLGVDRDDQVHIPVTTAQRLFGTDRIDAMAVRAPDRDTIRDLGDRIVAELSRRHPDTAFSAVTQDEIIGVLGGILSVLTWVLAAIAGISLLVGGVGVANIVLVSVRERFREIGLRKAVGARPRDIAVQFLLEAVLLTGVGGAAGIGLGVAAALLVAATSPVPAVVTWWSVALAFGVSNIVLVAVRERFRESGLRKAVGARPRDIAVQFLLEAVLLTGVGGAAGIGLGVAAALLVAATSPVPAVVTWWSVALAFGVSVAVGVAAGVVPAHRAGRLDPVVALRSE